MKFKNVKVPEGINVSRHNPLADLFLLSAVAVVVFGALALTVVLLGGMLARHSPIAWENALATTVFGDIEAPTGESDAQVERELQALAERLSARMDLPQGLAITVHYLSEDKVNAFASLGGHLFFFRGLLERLPNENALAMVMAHEIAHAANRDAAGALGGAVLLQLLLAFVLDSAPDTLEGLITGSNALLQFGFSREMERQADRDGLAAVAALYGHVAAAPTIFEIFLEESAERDGREPPEFLSTHPLSRDRIEDLVSLAEQRGWALKGAVTPLLPGIAELSDER